MRAAREKNPQKSTSLTRQKTAKKPTPSTPPWISRRARPVRRRRPLLITLFASPTSSPTTPRRCFTARFRLSRHKCSPMRNFWRQTMKVAGSLAFSLPRNATPCAPWRVWSRVHIFVFVFFCCTLTRDEKQKLYNKTNKQTNTQTNTHTHCASL